jgi:hypothetical protein
VNTDMCLVTLNDIRLIVSHFNEKGEDSITDRQLVTSWDICDERTRRGV